MVKPGWGALAASRSSSSSGGGGGGVQSVLGLAVRWRRHAGQRGERESGSLGEVWQGGSRPVVVRDANSGGRVTEGRQKGVGGLSELGSSTPPQRSAAVQQRSERSEAWAAGGGHRAASGERCAVQHEGWHSTTAMLLQSACAAPAGVLRAAVHPRWVLLLQRRASVRARSRFLAICWLGRLARGCC